MVVIIHEGLSGQGDTEGKGNKFGQKLYCQLGLLYTVHIYTVMYIMIMHILMHTHINLKVMLSSMMFSQVMATYKDSQT